MIDFEKTIISQYGNSTRILELISNMNGYIDPSVDLNTFYSMVWDIDTAQGFGLDIWGKIVGVSRNLQVSNTIGYLGFNEGQTAALDYQTFGSGIFYSGHVTGSYVLSDDAYRVLIYLKALANISNATIPSYNKLLNYMFSGRGRCYAVDNGLMQIRFVFEFALMPYEISILSSGAAIPRPSGVGVSLYQVDMAGTFGFHEASVGSVGDVVSQFILPQTLPFALGTTYDTSALVSYQPFGYGSFGSSLIAVI